MVGPIGPIRHPQYLSFSSPESRLTRKARRERVTDAARPPEQATKRAGGGAGDGLSGGDHDAPTHRSLPFSHVGEGRGWATTARAGVRQARAASRRRRSGRGAAATAFYSFVLSPSLLSCGRHDLDSIAASRQRVFTVAREIGANRSRAPTPALLHKAACSWFARPTPP